MPLCNPDPDLNKHAQGIVRRLLQPGAAPAVSEWYGRLHTPPVEPALAPYVSLGMLDPALRRKDFSGSSCWGIDVPVWYTGAAQDAVRIMLVGLDPLRQP